jgi:hypothetical protein
VNFGDEDDAVDVVDEEDTVDDMTLEEEESADVVVVDVVSVKVTLK